jgi:hypothetical protein
MRNPAKALQAKGLRPDVASGAAAISPAIQESPFLYVTYSSQLAHPKTGLTHRRIIEPATRFSLRQPSENQHSLIK